MNVADLSGSAEFEPGPPGIGVVAPYDFALDDEYRRWLGPGVAMYATRTPWLELPVGIEMAEAVSGVEDVVVAARALREARPAALLYACTSGSFVSGLAGERALCAAMGAASGAPAVTTSGGLLAALAALDVHAVAIATPYDAPVTERLVSFLGEAGHGVTGSAYLGLSADIARVTAATVRRLAAAADTPDADAVFLSCTNLRTFEVIAELEAELGKPVLSANQVSLWAALRAGGLPAADVDQRLFRAGDAR